MIVGKYREHRRYIGSAVRIHAFLIVQNCLKISLQLFNCGNLFNLVFVHQVFPDVKSIVETSGRDDPGNGVNLPVHSSSPKYVLRCLCFQFLSHGVEGRCDRLVYFLRHQIGQRAGMGPGQVILSAACNIQCNLIPIVVQNLYLDPYIQPVRLKLLIDRRQHLLLTGRFRTQSGKGQCDRLAVFVIQCACLFCFTLCPTALTLA